MRDVVINLIQHRENDEEPVKWEPAENGFMLHHDLNAETREAARNTAPAFVVRPGFFDHKNPQLGSQKDSSGEFISGKKRPAVSAAALLWVSDEITQKTETLISGANNQYQVLPAAFGPLALLTDMLIHSKAVRTSA